MYLKTIADDEAAGRVGEIFAAQKAQMGFVMEANRCWTTRPDLLPAYVDFLEKVRGGFSLGQREWRLITLVAARETRSTYCSLVYGRQLVEDLGSKEAVRAFQGDYRNVGLPEKDVEMLAYAEKVAKDAASIGPADIERLRKAGFSDRQIGDIALCAAFRCFVARYFDATGATPEAAFIDPDPAFRAAMTVGKRV
jgi:uncharacterized peroxidase-related enzyme